MFFCYARLSRRYGSVNLILLTNYTMCQPFSMYHHIIVTNCCPKIFVAPAYIVRLENIMASNPLTKVARQHESTWTSLQRRVSGMHYSYSSLFPENVFTFFQNKAISVGSSTGYLVPTLLTMTGFILAKNEATVQPGPNQQQLPNIFSLFVGHPGTGKSALVKDNGRSGSVINQTRRDFSCR